MLKQVPELKESVGLWRGLGDANQLGLAVSLREAGIVATYQGEIDQALSALEESIPLLQEVGSKWNLALAFYNQGLVYETKNDANIARAKFEESLSLFRELNEPWGTSVALYWSGAHYRPSGGLQSRPCTSRRIFVAEPRA